MTSLIKIESVLFYIILCVYFAATLVYFLYIGLKKESLLKTASLIQAAGFALHTAALICRGVGAGRMPMANLYEFSIGFAWAVCLVSLYFIRKFKFPIIGALATPLILLLLGYASMQNREIKALMPALRSSWLGFHISTVIIAYGALGVSAILGLVFLLRERMKKGGFWDTHVPDREKLDMISYRTVCLGMLFLTFTMINGAIWADQAWGAYWSWDPKEIWALVTWLTYSVYLHLRVRGGWGGKNAALFTLIGFICVLFTFIGVNNLLPGMHSYA